jgi:hypothetical protein
MRRGVLDVDPEEDRRFREEVLPAWTTDDLKKRIAAALAR